MAKKKQGQTADTLADAAVARTIAALPQGPTVMLYDGKNALKDFSFSKDSSVVSARAMGGHYVVMTRKSLRRMAEMAETYFETGEMVDPDVAA